MNTTGSGSGLQALGDLGGYLLLQRGKFRCLSALRRQTLRIHRAWDHAPPNNAVSASVGTRIDVLRVRRRRTPDEVGELYADVALRMVQHHRQTSGESR